MTKTILLAAYICLATLGYAQRGNELKNTKKPSPQTTKRNIFDFFKIDIKNAPDSSFIKAEITTNSAGQKIQFFRKRLSHKECGIFDLIEVVIIDDTSKNVFLKSTEPNNTQIPLLKRLINDLYLIYGKDAMGNGLFTDKDVKQFKISDDHILFGRSWIDYPKYDHPVTITRSTNELSINIWGIDK